MRKLATIGLSVATTLSLVGGGTLLPVAGAVTVAELQAQIAALQAQLETLMGGTSGGSCYTFTRDLYDGVSGDDVVALQDYLTGTGHFTFSGGSTGYYGPITTAAVAAWQAANGVAPAVGYFGPISRAMYDSLCVDEDMDEEEDEESTELEGGAGSIVDADWVSSLNNEEVGEGEEDVEVAGLDIEADDGSDIELTAVRLDFSEGTADRDFDKYADEVSVWFEGEEVARMDADEFEEDNNFDKTVSLESGSVIEAGDTGELVVAVSGIGNLDSNDSGETWTVEFESVRFRDAQGASVTDNATGDINGVTRTFSFETFATAADIELKIAEADNDAVNKAHMINIHASNDTENEILLDFTLEAEGTSDLEFREFGVDFVTSATNVDDVIAGGSSPQVEFKCEGESYGTASYNEDADGVDVGADEEVLFDDMDYTLPAGEKHSCQIVVELEDVNAGTLDEGDTILAQITETQTDDTALVDVRDEEGEQLADADISGTATGEANQMYDVTFVLSDIEWEDPIKTSSDTSGIDEQATFELSFDLTAVDGIVYVDDACTEDSDGTPSSDGMNYSSANNADFSHTCLVSSTTPDAGNNYVVQEDETETFTYTITVTAATASDTARLTFEGVEWSEADEAGDRLFTGNLNEYQSDGVYINNR